MFETISAELDYLLAMEDYHRTKLLYYKYQRQQLEQQIVSQSTIIQDEFDGVAEKAWSNGDKTYFI